jgi:CIC family chloride channel protein
VIQRSRRNYFPVEDGKTGELAGMVHLDDIRPYLFNRLMYDTVIVEQIMNAHVKTADIGESLSTVLSIMDREGLFSMPVLREKRFAGMISKATILDQYRKELMVQTPDS